MKISKDEDVITSYSIHYTKLYDLRSKAEAYLEAEDQQVFRSDIEEELAQGSWEALYERFYTSLAFGTAGMRGILGGGTNRMNTYMVRKVTQGLSDYLRNNFV